MLSVEKLMEELRHVQNSTLEIAIDCILGLLDDKQGYDLDDTTIMVCVGMLIHMKNGNDELP